MKNALICLEQLGIGGVETFTITQIEEFNRRGIKCYVMAKDGLLSSKIKGKKNVELIEFDFELKNYLDYDKISEIENIIKKKKIDFIYVHQFSCVPYILPVIFKTKTPYVAYLHNIVPKTCEWFMNTYAIFKVLFPIYFECASKIIAITDRVKEEHKNLFKLPEEMYITIKNSLDFSKYPDKELKDINCNYNKLLLFGRVSEQKRQSIYTAVEFYEYCKEKYNPKIKLTVVGDGEIYEEIVERYKDKDIYFKGAVSDMTPEIEEADVLLGVDRCMLEAVASKKPAIVCGYKNNTVLITPKNIEDAIEENFTGINLGDDKDELFKYNSKELTKILEDNYKYVSKNLTITNSIFLDIVPFESRANMNNIIDNINDYVNEIDNLKKENKELYLKTQELYSIIDTIKKRKRSIVKLARKVEHKFFNRRKEVE